MKNFNKTDMNLRVFERWIFINVNFHFSMHSIGPVGYGYHLIIFTRKWSRWVCIQVECVILMPLIWVMGVVLVLYVSVTVTLFAYVIYHIYLYAASPVSSFKCPFYRKGERGKKNHRNFPKNYLSYIFALKYQLWH